MINFKQKDKQGHFIVGLLIAFFVGLINPLTGLGASMLAGFLKEQYDKKHPLKHTYDLNDMYATWLGAWCGFFFSLIIWRL